MLAFITNIEMYYYLPLKIFSCGLHQLRSLRAVTGIRRLIMTLKPTLPKLLLLIQISLLCSPTPSSATQMEEQHRLKKATSN